MDERKGENYIPVGINAGGIKTKVQISCVYTSQLICTFVFATDDSTMPLLSQSKIQTSSHLCCLFSLVCVGPCQKTQRLLFSGRGSYGYLRRHPVKEILHPCLVIIAHFHCHFNNRLLCVSILSLQLRHHYKNINI